MSNGIQLVTRRCFFIVCGGAADEKEGEGAWVRIRFLSGSQQPPKGVTFSVEYPYRLTAAHWLKLIAWAAAEELALENLGIGQGRGVLRGGDPRPEHIPSPPGKGDHGAAPGHPGCCLSWLGRRAHLAIRHSMPNPSSRAGVLGFQKRTPHPPRHTAATLLLNERGANLRDVQTLLGHKSLATGALHLSIANNFAHWSGASDCTGSLSFSLFLFHEQVRPKGGKGRRDGSYESFLNRHP